VVVDDTEQGKLLVVVVARVTRHHPGAAKAAGLTHEVAFVVKTSVTVCTQAKLELVTLLVAFFLGQVHERDVGLDVLLLGSDSSRKKRRTLVIVETFFLCVGAVVLVFFLVVIVIPAAVVRFFGLATP